MTKVRLLAAIIAVSMLAACSDVAPTAPENGDARCGWMGSGC